MTKKTFLAVLMAYSSTGTALPVNLLHSSSMIRQVKEGLDASPPPLASLQDAWASTFLLYFTDSNQNAEWGSAFVIANRLDGNTRTIDLLTANHVLAPFCDSRQCRNLMIFANGDVEFNPQMDGPAHRTLPFKNPKLRVLARDEWHDLALVRITVSAGINPAPIPLANDAALPGERTWAIGFPNIFKRLDQKGIIGEPYHMVRRWSVGVAMRPGAEVQNYKESMQALRGFTPDSLPGNSGGPLLNDRGQIVAVMSLSGSSKDTTFHYAQLFGANKIPSAGVNLASVREFIETTNRSKVLSSL